MDVGLGVSHVCCKAFTIVRVLVIVFVIEKLATAANKHLKQKQTKTQTRLR